MTDEKKGRSFTGLLGGANYDRLSALAGLRAAFYRRAAMAIPLQPGMRVLDLGCGTGSFSLAVAERIGPDGSVDGVDISEEQIARARNRAAYLRPRLQFHVCSMDEPPFEDATFDAVVSSMAFHEAAPEVRRGAIREAARVLKPEGLFPLVDWSKPRFCLSSIIWLPFLLLDTHRKDNWNNTYPELCRRHGLLPSTDVYLDSLVRCQVFRKGEAAGRPVGTQ